MREAHPNVYLIGNLGMLFMIWAVSLWVIWSFSPFWWPLNIVIMIAAFWLSAWVQHKHLTKVVGFIVERWFPYGK
jgi:hypothetical protein